MSPRKGTRTSTTVAVEWAEEVEQPVADVDEAWIERVVQQAVAGRIDEGTEYEVVVLLAGETTLHALNRQYRGKDRPTDVLSFEGGGFEPPSGATGMGDAGSPALPDLPGLPVHLGDIAISLERARRQAVEYGHSFERELGYLLVHGTLHLLGFDHEIDDDQQEMRAAEEEVLSALNLGRDVPSDVAPAAAGERPRTHAASEEQ